MGAYAGGQELSYTRVISWRKRGETQRKSWSNKCLVPTTVFFPRTRTTPRLWLLWLVALALAPLYFDVSVLNYVTCKHHKCLHVGIACSIVSRCQFVYSLIPGPGDVPKGLPRALFQTPCSRGCIRCSSLRNSLD
jgi:hypothetical protein